MIKEPLKDVSKPERSSFRALAQIFTGDRQRRQVEQKMVVRGEV